MGNNWGSGPAAGRPDGKRQAARRFRRLFAAALVFLLLSSGCAAYAEKLPELRYYALDVGQADCSLFMLPTGENVVVDAGRRGSKKEMVDRLKSLGVEEITLFVATHPHEDHIGGAAALLDNFKVGQIWDSGYNHGSKVQLDFYSKVKEKGVRFGRPKRGHKAQYGGLKIEVLAPARQLKGTRSDANNNSIVLLASYGETDFLMMADAEEEERASVGRFPQAEVLKAAHHGAANGSDYELFSQVRPKIVVLSYGEGNSYGHPHKETVELIRRFKAKRFDTADGPVEIRTDGENIVFDPARTAVGSD